MMSGMNRTLRMMRIGMSLVLVLLVESARYRLLLWHGFIFLARVMVDISNDCWMSQGSVV